MHEVNYTVRWYIISTALAIYNAIREPQRGGGWSIEGDPGRTHKGNLSLRRRSRRLWHRRFFFFFFNITANFTNHSMFNDPNARVTDLSYNPQEIHRWNKNETILCGCNENLFVGFRLRYFRLNVNNAQTHLWFNRERSWAVFQGFFFFEVQLRERVLGLVREGLEGWIVLCAVELRISLNLQAGERNSPPEFTFVPCM